MSHYRFYSLDERGRVLQAPVIRECSDDDEALWQAASLVGDFPIEIWDEGRRVGTLKPGQ